MKRLLLVLIAACGVDRGPAPAPAPAPAPVKPATRDAAAAPEEFVGVLAAAQSVDIAPRAAGVVMKLDVATGDAVTMGQVVAEMDPVGLQEELRAAEAALGAATAAHRQAIVDVEDAKRKVALETQAVADGVSARSVLEEAKFAVKRAEAAEQKAAATQAAEASRAQTARDHVGDTQLRAPFDGTVAQRFHDAGNRIEAGGAILRIVGNGGMRLRFAVPPDRAHALALGAKVMATIDTVAAPVAATIKQISPTIDAASGMVIVEAELADGGGGALRPGLAARVKP
ncbi:MAG: efflux RND transporter periplasmic adaptor subunit [Deltaproteobacteria bacterium]|nr:efflux RND transporter periplasmic adaptor subunit [Deltaproteobacteria bacterium]